VARDGSSTAIVMGGSIAGSFAARVLSDFFDRVIVIDRDEFPREPVEAWEDCSTPHRSVRRRPVRRDRLTWPEFDAVSTRLADETLILSRASIFPTMVGRQGVVTSASHSGHTLQAAAKSLPLLNSHRHGPDIAANRDGDGRACGLGLRAATRRRISSGAAAGMDEAGAAEGAVPAMVGLVQRPGDWVDR
jgi:hypothetical protein